MNLKSAVYAGYVYDNPKTNWTKKSDVKDSLTYVNFEKDCNIPFGGIPIISDGTTGYIDTSDNHCVIYGSSGAKKSTCLYMPTICTLAKANENMVISDPKGELYCRTGAYVRSQGYRIIVVNFRDYNGDAYNPLYYPAKLWKEVGDTDKASLVTSDFCSALAQSQEENRKVDPFWPSTAKAFINGVVPLMFDSYKNISDINIMTLADYFTEHTADLLKGYVNKSHITNAAMTNLRTVLSEPEKTRMSSLATCSSFIQPFIQNDKLARMLSYSTFELEDLTKEKTALYIITDDTTTVCNPIVGVLLSQLSTVLIDKAFHSESGKLSTRVNFLLDEFCSFPIPGICEALATHRSRNIRYYLCIQSLDALSDKYPHYESLLANCATSLFLGSTEIKLLENISQRCGETERTATGKKEPLISVPELMTLRKSWDFKEAIYLNLSDATRYCTTLPAIEQYKDFNKYGKSRLPNRTYPKVTVYTFRNLLNDISAGKAKRPFEPFDKKKGNKKSKSNKSEEAYELNKWLQRESEIKFHELFDDLSDDEEN